MKSEGYLDVEFDLPPLEDGRPPADLRLTMRRRESAPPRPKTFVRGRVTRNGVPAAGVGLVCHQNAGRPEIEGIEIDPVLRGVPIPWRGIPCGGGETKDDGNFVIETSHGVHRFLFVSVIEPSADLVTLGPFDALCPVDAVRSIELEVRRGSIRGKIDGFRPTFAGRYYAIIFDTTVFLDARRIGPDGRFEFFRLPAGRYGILIGDDGRPPFANPRFEGERFVIDLDPWRDACVVDLSPGETREVSVALNGH